MSSNHEPADPPVALAELREQLNLFSEMPSIEFVHLPMPLMVDPSDRTIAICIHDQANECAHAVWYPAPNGPQDLVDEDGEVKPEVQIHCEHYLCAAYN